MFVLLLVDWKPFAEILHPDEQRLKVEERVVQIWTLMYVKVVPCQ